MGMEPTSRLRWLDLVTVLPAEKTHEMMRSVNNEREHIQEVTPQDAHIKRFFVGTGDVFASKGDLVGIFSCQTDAGCDNHHLHHAANASDGFMRSRCFQLQGFQDVGAENRPVCTRINQKLSGSPSAAASQNLAAHDRSYDAIVTEIPVAVKLHRREPFFPWG